MTVLGNFALVVYHYFFPGFSFSNKKKKNNIQYYVQLLFSVSFIRDGMNVNFVYHEKGFVDQIYSIKAIVLITIHLTKDNASIPGIEKLIFLKHYRLTKSQKNIFFKIKFH